MNNDNSKWYSFGIGASPAFFFFLYVINTRTSWETGLALFFYSILYLIIGLIIFAGMQATDPEKKALSKPFLAGVLAGVFIAFVLTISTCS